MSRQPMTDSGINEALSALNAGSAVHWEVRDGKLHKNFVFRDFVEAFGFMTRGAIEAERLNHHPEWSNVYRNVDIYLTTHEAGGITDLDFELAKRLESRLE